MEEKEKNNLLEMSLFDFLDNFRRTLDYHGSGKRMSNVLYANTNWNKRFKNKTLTVHDLLQKEKVELFALRNFGEKSYTSLEKLMKQHGINTKDYPLFK